MVPENVRANLTSDNSYGTSRLGFLVLSCHFKLGSCDWDCSPCVHFLGDGVGGRCPTYKLPIVDCISFSEGKPEKGCWLECLSSCYV
jgi:hypothetical protein